MLDTGWLLDAYVEGRDAVLWFRLEDGSSLMLLDRYRPDFYASPTDKLALEDVASSLQGHENVDLVTVEEKFCSLDAMERSKVLHIFVDEVSSYRKVLRDLEDSKLLKSFYNVDLLHVQRYLLSKNVAPTSLVEVEHDGSRLAGTKVLDDSTEIAPPPFSLYAFALEPSSRIASDAISGITLLDDGLKARGRLQGREPDVLSDFQGDVLSHDPDFLIFHDVPTVLKRLKVRSELRGVDLQVGRIRDDEGGSPFTTSLSVKGRACIELGGFEEYGVAGIVERSKFTFAPPGFSAEWPAGRTIDSRQCYEVLRRDILIPKRGFYVEPKSGRETLLRDRGGFTMAPEAGLHENVGELDYESMFPNIIIKWNVSYETVGSDRPDDLLGLLRIVAKEPLERRLRFKHLRKRLPKDSREWLWCEQRQTSLKGILVCIYGFSGCFANRYGNVTTFEEVNWIARDKLVKTVNIAFEKGFKVIYADTDSIFVKKPRATSEDYEDLAREIASKVGLPIALDHHYKFLVLLKRETDSRLEVAKRYFGKLVDGTFNYRGIELRRHDAPPFVKDFQEELMRILFDADSAEEVRSVQFHKALSYVREACMEVIEGKVSCDRLAVSKRLSREVGEYTGRLPHVVAAKQLAMKGGDVRSGDLVDFLYVNTGHRNPYRRVVPAGFVSDRWRGYDKSKYVDVVQDAAEKILSVFGFKRINVRGEPQQTDLLGVI